MKKAKDIALRMLPVVLMVLVTVCLSNQLYRMILEREEENCWNELKAATNDVSKEMNIRFSDNMNMLDLAADAVVLKSDPTRDETILSYLSIVKNKTIFERIDVLFPNNQILMLSGEYVTDDTLTPYNELLERGSFISTRRTDPYTKKEVIYYFTPIFTNGKAEGILIGVIDCNHLKEMFVSEHYQGESHIFLVDRRDGNVLINNWHNTLGNIKEMTPKSIRENYTDDDFVTKVLNGEKVDSAFESDENGQLSYMSYTPLEDFPYSVSLFIQEEVIFAESNKLSNILLIVGIVELILLLLILFYNIYVVINLESERKKVMDSEVEKNKTEAKTNFLSSVSHDIRTPLNGIIGMLDIINIKGNIPEHMKDPLHKIEVSARHLLNLASDVLDLNALETGKVVYESNPINLITLAEEIGMVMQPKASERNIEYILDCTNIQTPYVLGSAVHISKLLSNLVSNAIKYNKPNGNVKLIVEQDSIRGNVGYYRFTVSDTGIGIAEEFKESMFNAFEQENAGARTSQTSHGLGLSIVKRIVNDLNGTIEVESKKNVGTTFVVTLPLKINKERSVENEVSFSEDALVNAKILLVEDNDFNIEIADTILTNSGAKVTCAENGKVAVEIFEKSEPFSFDLVLMDIMMPEMDGYEACKTIRKMDRPDSREIPIIAMTANTFSEDIKKCKESGMDEHIGKPIDMKTLIMKVSRHIERYQNKNQ